MAAQQLQEMLAKMRMDKIAKAAPPAPATECPVHNAWDDVDDLSDDEDFDAPDNGFLMSATKDIWASLAEERLQASLAPSQPKENDEEPVAALPPLANEAVVAKEEELAKEEPAAALPPTPEEAQVLRWFRESQRSAKEPLQRMRPDDEYVWVDMPVGAEAIVVELTQERMQEIGLVTTDGKPPTDEEPAKLFWIQDKPAEHKDKYGLWDPVGAQWCMYPQHTVVPVEQRIGPIGKGYGSTADGARLHSAEQLCSFKAAEFKNQEPYLGTAIEPAIPHIVAQVEAMGDAFEVPVMSGWGSNTEGTVSYYTPHLRHLAINDAIAPEPGKKYLYMWPHEHVKPVQGHATWDETNSCWVYTKGGADDAKMADCCTGCPMCDERTKDQAMAAKK